MQRATFDDYDAAKKHANALVKQMGNGGQDMLVLRGPERRAYERANQLLQSSGLDLDGLVTDSLAANKLLDGMGTLKDAANYFAKHRPKALPNITVEAVVAEFIESRKLDEAGKLYLRDLRLRLGHFAKAFRCPISMVSVKDIDRYLARLKVSKRTRYNHRGTIGTLMNYAKEQDYLSPDFQSMKKVGKRPKWAVKVVVFTPEEMAKLLGGASPQQALPLAITAFAGVRAEEVKRLDCSEFKLAKGHIEVPASKAKNKIRRLVPILPNLRAWLQLHLPKKGPVCAFKNLSNQYLKLAAKVGVKWRRNGLRHSYVSYRVADVSNIPQVALESGHTVKMLQTDYLEVVDKETAVKWFSIQPELPQNIVPMTAGETQVQNRPKTVAAAK